MCVEKPTSVSQLMQCVDGPISGDMRLAIMRLGELVFYLPDDMALEGRRAVMALADACIRVHGLENAACIGSEGVASWLRSARRANRYGAA